ncbi:DUF6702 family protein [Arcticibacter sp. MXS-1]|uniref:DUF6702 family protein n=1 Tax=Arcticibacter sp. MXS-1 TaxID=3341726 RepID=UPI0035A91BEE
MLQFLLLFNLLMHPFYVSVTEIRHNEKNKVLEISSRVFFDDFEAALEKRYKVPVNILKPADRKKVDQLIADYMKKHLQVSLDGKKQELRYLGYEIEEDGAWCYFETAAAERPKNVVVTDNILYDEHSSQINMIHVIVNGVRKSTKLDNPSSRAAFSF